MSFPAGCDEADSARYGARIAVGREGVTPLLVDYNFSGSNASYDARQ